MLVSQPLRDGVEVRLVLLAVITGQEAAGSPRSAACELELKQQGGGRERVEALRM